MISIGENLKKAAMAAWESKKFSAEKPNLHVDLSPEGHFQLEVAGSAKMSMDLPGGLDGLLVGAIHAAEKLGNSPL